MLALLLLTLRAQPHGCKEGLALRGLRGVHPVPRVSAELHGARDRRRPTDPDGGSLNIIGTIPSAIGNLTALTTLAIAENGVSGTIPETIGLLTMLKSLRSPRRPHLVPRDD